MNNPSHIQLLVFFLPVLSQFLSSLHMARNIPKLHFHQLAFLPSWFNLLNITAAFVGIICVFSIVMFLCGSHEERRSKRRPDRKTERLGDQRAFKRLQSSMSSTNSKALLLSKMISWRKVQDEGDGDHDDDDDDDNNNSSNDEAIWKKTIIKGEKCRPLNFSGQILYDSDGNRLPDSPQPTQGKVISPC